MTTSELSTENQSFSTQLPVQVYQRTAGATPGSDWQELDAGPGVLILPTGSEFRVRARNLDDETLPQLIEELTGIREIIALDIAECRNVTNEGIRFLKALPHLTELNLSSCSLTDSGLAELKPLNHLLRLNLSYCNRITNLGLQKIRDLRRLEYLDLQGCVKINRGGLVKVQRHGLVIHK
ncbi:hypothetical protein FDZ74_05435 [bacterium]|nr:MAG: hypothetical protein FDZ74_05435 [bacterium]